MRTSARRLLEAWEKTQVELQGQYSTPRYQELHAYYQETSLLRVTGVLLLTPLPCLIVVTLWDVPKLQDPSDGVYANHIFWIRIAVVAGMMSSFFLVIITSFIQGLELRRLHLIVVGLITALVVPGFLFALARIIGFPLPFMTVCATLPFEVVTLSSAIVLWGKAIYHSSLARKQLRNAIGIVITQWSLTLVYPVYYVAFLRLHGAAQAGFAVLFL